MYLPEDKTGLMPVTRFIQHRVKQNSLCAGDKVSQRKNTMAPADKAYNRDETQSIYRLAAAFDF